MKTDPLKTDEDCDYDYDYHHACMLGVLFSQKIEARFRCCNASDVLMILSKVSWLIPKVILATICQRGRLLVFSTCKVEFMLGLASFVKISLWSRCGD